MFINTFEKKTVLITGHTGFKGSWLALWLQKLGARVIGLSIDLPSRPSNFEASKIYNFAEDNRIDVRDYDSVSKLIINCKPDFVFHLAAQPLVIPSYNNPLETISTNALGTANILEALRYLNKEVTAVMITSDKVYNNVEWVWGYREIDQIGGKDPYSASKGMAEMAIKTYFESYFKDSDSKIRIGIARAGNVIGGGDWAADRLVPDCIKAWSSNQVVDIRNPQSTRPWQHVLEPLSGYLVLASSLKKNFYFSGQAFNFGPPGNQNFSVKNLIDEMSNYWTKVKWQDISKNKDVKHEAGLLKLNCDKALSELNWLPSLKFEETVKMTVEWYKHYYQNDYESMFEFSVSQIEEYIKIANSRGVSWSNDK